MIDSAKGINTFNSLMYLAMFFITFTIFPFYKYGLGSGKSLSFIPLILYITLNVFKGRLFVAKKFLIEIFMIGIILLLSFFLGVLRYNSILGFSFSLSMWMSYVLVMTALYTFFKAAEINDIRNFLLSIFYSFKISLIFGILEVIYQIIAPIGLIKFLVCFFVRDEMYISSRVQFNFGEPSECVFIVILLFPVIYLLNKLHYKFSLFDKFFVCMLVIIAFLFSKSVTFILFFSTFCLLYFASRLQNKNKKKLKTALILFSILTLVALVFIVNYLEEYAFSNDVRALKLLIRPEDALKDDFSSATRIGLWVVSFYMFWDSPIMGCGFGYFGTKFKDFVWSIDKVFLTPEMLSKTSDLQQQTYSIITAAFCEGGFLGILWLILLLSRLKFNSQYNILFVPLFLLMIFQSMFIYIPTMCLLYFLLTNHKILKIANQYEYEKN